MILQAIKNSSFFKKVFLGKFVQNWVAEKGNRIIPFLKQSDQIVDIGAGNGMLAYYLKEKGFQIKAVDVENHSIIPEMPTIVYDGQHLPFEDKSFDTALLLTVLHHTDDPVAVLKEAARVARQIVIIEDVYTNIIQKYLTFFMDTLVNLGHSNMTYQNRSTSEWQLIFKDLGLKMVKLEEKKVLFFFRQATFVLG